MPSFPSTFAVSSGAKTSSLALLLTAVCAFPLCALDTRLFVHQYLHTSWTQEEGVALPAINSLAQTNDGYLWLGTSSGIIRFDGMRFVHWEPPSGEAPPEPGVRYLKASSRGGMWIGTVRTISRFDGHHLIRYPSTDQWLASRNHMAFEDHAGTLWIMRATNTPELGALLPSGELRVYSAKDGLPGHGLRNVFEDSGSRLWIATARELCQWAPSQTAACVDSPWAGALSVSGTGAADFLAADPAVKTILSLRRPQAATADARDLPALKCILRDHDGGIWVGTVGQGLLRVADGRFEQFDRRSGLSADLIPAVLEDREHNVWVATERGLDRFRDRQALSLNTADGLSNDIVSAVQTALNGDVWVGTVGGGLNQITGNRAVPYPAVSGLPRTTISALFEDSGHRLWVGTASGFGYLANGHFVEVRSGKGQSLNNVFAIAAGPQDAIWLADSGLGVFTVQGNVAQLVVLPGVAPKDIYQVYFDRDGALWIGSYNGGLIRVEGGEPHNFTARDGLAPGRIQAIAQDRSGAIWVGAQGGLSRLRNGAWTTWGSKHGVPEGGVWGILEDDLGSLWFMTAQGLSRQSLDTLNQSSDGAPRKLEFTLYGQYDGVRLAASPSMSGPRSAKAADGRLWISTNDGVAIVDPARIHSNPLPPPVVVEEMELDGRSLPLDIGKEASFRGRQVRFTYTGLSLMLPERVRFRYMLEGFDKEWTEVGGRRSVDYVNLPPSSYRFRVTACNNDGVWNPTGATVAFRIEPYFYQTMWFKGACVLCVGLIALGIHQMRVRFVMTRYQATVHERTRLARELHDSLLQGFVAVVYQLEAAARQIESAPEAGQKRLGRAIEQADRALTEARLSMMAMRLPELEDGTLTEALEECGTGLTNGRGITFHLDVKGRTRQLPYETQANLFIIAREAISNAVNHANARRIQASVVFTPRQVRLVVEDDGVGFDVEEGKAKQGHWGMEGMQQRADQIGATFSIRSSPGEGATLEVVAPSKN